MRWNIIVCVYQNIFDMYSSTQTQSVTKIDQHTLAGIDSPVLHTTDFTITIQPVLWQLLIWCRSHSVPIITLTLRAKRPCFCICRKKLPLKASPIICHECGDMLHLTVSLCCASLRFRTDALTGTRTQTPAHTSWQTEVGGKVTSHGEVVHDSEIDRIYSDADREGFLFD